MENSAMTGSQPGFDDDVFAAATVSRVPVRPSLAETMQVSLLLNPQHQVWLLHDKYFDDIVMWAEYDIDAASLSLILNGGKVQPLGLRIEAPVRKYLRHARQLYTVLMRGTDAVDTYSVPLLVRETGYYKG